MSTPSFLDTATINDAKQFPIELSSSSCSKKFSDNSPSFFFPLRNFVLIRFDVCKILSGWEKQSFEFHENRSCYFFTFLNINHWRLFWYKLEIILVVSCRFDVLISIILKVFNCSKLNFMVENIHLNVLTLKFMFKVINGNYRLKLSLFEQSHGK